MTKSTATRQLTPVVKGILSHYKIDNLQLEADLCGAIKRLYTDADPVRTREQILASLRAGIVAGSLRHERLERIASVIRKRVNINPIGRTWDDFLKWALDVEELGQTIDKFLDWWLADEWQRTHPPSKPEVWIVKWPQAFVVQKSERTSIPTLERNV